MKALLYPLIAFLPLMAATAQSNQSVQNSPAEPQLTEPTVKRSDSKSVANDGEVRNQSESAQSQNVSSTVRLDWRENMHKTIPATICAESSWHLQCFNVRESQCLGATSEVIDQCIDYVVAHDSASVADPAHLFEQTSVCVITLYERRFARRFKFLQQCTDRSKW